MDMRELEILLEEFRALPAETEWLEFKEARTSYDFNRMGKYFSALSNEANLKNKAYGWLIFGVEDKTRGIVGTTYRSSRLGLDSLKQEITHKTTNRITFAEIHEVMRPEGRVIMFQIPAALPGIPTAWEGHYYGRNGESLGALNLQEIEQIRRQGVRYDWSAQICEAAALKDLDANAISKAREEYKKKHPRLADEVDTWDDETFLNKAKVIVNGKITRAAILLLGKPEAEHYLTPAHAEISWVLKDENNIEKDYEHFGPPFIRNADEVLAKIRNLKYRYLPDNTLFPIEINQYDTYVIREALHNCIAHQDYELQGRIAVVERPDELIFVNPGSFIPQSIETVITQDAPPEYYRNKFLASTMVNLNMIDTIGSGIKRMFLQQRKRFFPLPSFDLSKPSQVKVTITGKVIDPKYTQILIDNTDLSLETIMYLDKVQKKIKLNEHELKVLKAQKLVEGRAPNLFVASSIAAVTGDKSTYIKNRAFDDGYYKEMVLAYLKEYGAASRGEVDVLLLDKLSDALDAKQKKNKVRNLLYAMSKKDLTIMNIGTVKQPKWVLSR